MHSRKYGVNLGWWLVVYDIFTFNINHLGWFQMYFSIPTLTLTLLIKAIPHLTKTKLAQNIQKKFGLTDIVLLNITFMWIHLHKIFYYFEKFVSLNLLDLMWSCTQSLTCCRLPPELPHWWGGRRGRTGGGGAILWGATDRDGMGGPGEGRQGTQRRSNSPRTEWPHHDITLGTPPHTTHSCNNISLFSLPVFTLVHSHHLSISCYGGLTCACLCWTLPTSWNNVADSICLISSIAWLECREMVQLKTTKWNPGKNKPLSLC